MKKVFALSIGMVLAAVSIVPAAATPVVVETEFNTSDGFITGGVAANPGDPIPVVAGSFDPVTLDGLVTFAGGQQQQMFNGPSYNNGPAGFLFINSGVGFTGTSGDTAAGTGDTGLIDFGGLGASSVSFFGANQGNGPATALTILGVDDTTVLGTVSVSSSSLTQLTFLASDFAGQLIGAIAINLPGPASPVNPPYVFAIDTFAATIETPLPGAAVLLLTGLAGFSATQRKKKSA